MDYSIHYSRFHDGSEEDAKREAKGIRALLEPHVPKDRSVLIVDVGCGFGFALRALRDLGFTNLLGVEASPQQAERARAAGFEVIVTDRTADWLRENRGRFAFLVLMDVLEHIPVEMQIDFANALQESLTETGKLFLTVPNANSILASRWRYIDFTHHSSFTEYSLFYVLKSAGFGEIAIGNAKLPIMKPLPKRLWRPEVRQAVRRWIVRWIWIQIYKAELPWEKLDPISFDLNLNAIATKG